MRRLSRSVGGGEDEKGRKDGRDVQVQKKERKKIIGGHDAYLH